MAEKERDAATQKEPETSIERYLELPSHLRTVGSSSSIAAMSDSSAARQDAGSSDSEDLDCTLQPDGPSLALIERCVEDAAFAPIHFQELLTDNLEEIFPSSPNGEPQEVAKSPVSPVAKSRRLTERTRLEKYILWGRLSSPFLVFLLIGIVLVVLAKSHLSQLLNLLEHLPWFESTVIFIFLFTIISFPFGIGYIVLNMVAGYLYGFVKGQLLVMISVTAGITISFFFCRLWFRDYARKMVMSNAMQAIMRVVEGKNGLKVIVLTRLTPIPFGLQNVLFSVSGHRVWLSIALYVQEMVLSLSGLHYNAHTLV